MKYFKDANNNVYAYEADGSQDAFIKNGLVAITEAEKDLLVNPPETTEQVIARLEGAIDRYLDEQAQTLRYESIRTIVTYDNDINPRFKAEGIAGKTLRSNCYTLGIEIMTNVLNGTREIPTEAELIDEMPKITDYLIY